MLLKGNYKFIYNQFGGIAMELLFNIITIFGIPGEYIYIFLNLFPDFLKWIFIILITLFTIRGVTIYKIHKKVFKFNISGWRGNIINVFLHFITFIFFVILLAGIYNGYLKHEVFLGKPSNWSVFESWFLNIPNTIYKYMIGGLVRDIIKVVISVGIILLWIYSDDFPQSYHDWNYLSKKTYDDFVILSCSNLSKSFKKKALKRAFLFVFYIKLIL